MPRARLIKPDFFDDQKLGTISRGARLTFAGLWVYSDDYGVVKSHPVWLKNKIYPYDDMQLDVIKGELSELQKNGLIILFQHAGEDFYFIKNFLKHQTINRPSKNRNPEPPENFHENSGSATGGLPEDSGGTQEKNSHKESRNRCIVSQRLQKCWASREGRSSSICP